MPKINIFCKASFTKGLGHLIRQIHIAKEFRRQNREVYFYIPNFQTAIDILKQNNFSYYTIENFDSAPIAEKENSAGLYFWDQAFAQLCVTRRFTKGMNDYRSLSKRFYS